MAGPPDAVAPRCVPLERLCLLRTDSAPRAVPCCSVAFAQRCPGLCLPSGIAQRFLWRRRLSGAPLLHSPGEEKRFETGASACRSEEASSPADADRHVRCSREPAGPAVSTPLPANQAGFLAPLSPRAITRVAPALSGIPCAMGARLQR